MYYARLRNLKSVEQKRAIRSLRRLRKQLSVELPQKDQENSLLLATWNIRDLTKTKKRRLPEALYYIAETISRFDFVAVQEVNGLEEWEKIMRVLGRDWDYIASDEADRKEGGNGERLTYAFDRRKVNFQKIAGELVLPREMLISKEAKGGRQFSRTPFVARFQCGWFKFSICTVHIYFGSESGAKLKRRIGEIGKVANYFGEKADRVLRNDDRTMILLGDFNIVSKKHSTMTALTDNGFEIPKSLQDKPSNQNKTKHYDQIAFKTNSDVMNFVDQPAVDGRPGNSGVFDPYPSVFRLQDESKYANVDGRGTTSFTTWRSYQVSDHLPMWVRLDVNDTDEYLEGLLDE